MFRFSLLIISVLYVNSLFSQDLIGYVSSVYDGDSFTLIDEKGIKHKVRLANIDCPEMNQEFGIMAQAFTATLILNENIIVNVERGKDRYNRWLGVVENKGINLNRQLVRLGLAWVYDRYNDDLFIKKLEAFAKENELGLWLLDNPINPAVYRKLKK